MEKQPNIKRAFGNARFEVVKRILDVDVIRSLTMEIIPVLPIYGHYLLFYS